MGNLELLSLEFGAYDPREAFYAMQAENWLYHYAELNEPRSERIKADVRRVFYPNDDYWKKMVWARANYVIDQALANVSGNLGPRQAGVGRCSD